MARNRVLTSDPPNIGVDPRSLNGDTLNQANMFVRCNFPVPIAPPTGFEVIIPGRATRRVTLETLDAFAEIEIEMVLECAGNGRTLMEPTPDGTPWDFDAVSPIRVRGVRLVDLLGRLPDSVVCVVFTGGDHGSVPFRGDVPYQFSLSRDLAVSPTPLIATHIDNERIVRDHGGPMRLFVPGHYGMKSVKWLTRVEAMTMDFRGHFVEKYRFRGDSLEDDGAQVGEIFVRSTISHPGEDEPIYAGSVDVSGSAWTGSGDITKVEVSVDGGEVWLEADLIREQTASRYAPVRWAIPLEFDPGTVELMARATDSTGATQPLESRWNARGYANNVVQRLTFDVAAED